MPSSYTDLGLELMVTGENSGTWGDKTNTNLNRFRIIYNRRLNYGKSKHSRRHIDLR
jgi:hypothetical protein